MRIEVINEIYLSEKYYVKDLEYVVSVSTLEKPPTKNRIGKVNF